jgi:outer membrane biosynthesis protein TonB
MTEIILITAIALLIFGAYKFLKKDEKESTEKEISIPELDLPIETPSTEEEVKEEPVIEEIPVQEPVKEVKAIRKPKETTETKKTTEDKKVPVKKKGRPKKSQ